MPVWQREYPGTPAECQGYAPVPRPLSATANDMELPALIVAEHGGDGQAAVFQRRTGKGLAAAVPHAGRKRGLPGRWSMSPPRWYPHRQRGGPRAVFPWAHIEPSHPQLDGRTAVCVLKSPLFIEMKAIRRSCMMLDKMGPFILLWMKGPPNLNRPQTGSPSAACFCDINGNPTALPGSPSLFPASS